MIKDGQ
jgi:hypothetical protein